MARRKHVPEVHVAPEGARWAISLRVGEAVTHLETQPTRKAAGARARDWIAIYRARPHPVWSEDQP